MSGSTDKSIYNALIVSGNATIRQERASDTGTILWEILREMHWKCFRKRLGICVENSKETNRKLLKYY